MLCVVYNYMFWFVYFLPLFRMPFLLILQTMRSHTFNCVPTNVILFGFYKIFGTVVQLIIS